jgi:hypothetical protein
MCRAVISALGAPPGLLPRCKLDGEPTHSAVPPLLFGLRLWPQSAWRSMPRSDSNSTNAFWAGTPAAVPDVRRYSVIIQAAKVLI